MMNSGGLPALVGQAPSFLETLERASAAAAIDRSVLVIGERGTGKELIAARLHFLSRRWDQPYVKLNCAALSDQLLESELFGHEAGAFTGATARREGRFERADGGTVFLDEIATASARVQEKILRVIEYGEFERLGGERTLTVDTRVIAATNEDLPSLAAEGRFRADLLDRLAFDVITLPPLRARWEDVPILAEHFGRRIAAEVGLDRFEGFSHAAMGALIDHTWPGNVRELKNVVERAVYQHAAAGAPGLIGGVTLDPFASPWRPGAPDPAPSPGEDVTRADVDAPTSPAASLTEEVASLEIQRVRQALNAAHGHQGRAADRLGLTYHQLRGLMRKHAIKAKRGDSEAA